MSINNQPAIIANLEGIWRKDNPDDELHGYKWSEVVRLYGAKEDYDTEQPIYLSLDDEAGNFIELYSDWEGFDEAVKLITKSLINIEQDWFSKIEALPPGGDGVDIWKSTK